MIVRAVLIDIYKTLLEVGPPPLDAGARWSLLCAARVGASATLGLDDFGAAAQAVIAREHAAARSAGIPFPEVFWPAVARQAWPALATLQARALDDFLFEHAQLQRTVTLAAGAAEVLRELQRRGVPLGLVSNSQPYTLRELEAELAGAGLKRELFAPDLCFFSFEHGFSKPDPHVFRLLAARLAGRGIAPAEALVVGDREDNDIAPAQRAGFATWRLDAAAVTDKAGSWRALGLALDI